MSSLGLINLVIVVVVSLWSSSLQAGFCSDIYSNQVLSPLPGPLQSVQPWELARAGDIVNTHNRADVIAKVLGRDGNYPFLVTTTGELVISHRLPSWEVAGEGPFLATHWSLYKQLTFELGGEPAIAFSGQFRVHVGRVESLIDQSESFYLLPKDVGGELLLISFNQARLDYAHKILQEKGLADTDIQSQNYWETFRLEKEESPARNKELGENYLVSRFELMCRQSSCWEDYIVLQSIVNEITKRGGSKYFTEAGRGNKEVHFEWGTEHMFIAMALSEGVMTVMAKGSNYSKDFVRRLVDNPQGYLKALDSNSH